MGNEAHVRIDEGIKRGPRHKHKPPRSPKADIGSWVIPTDLNPDVVIERYLTETTTSQIAAQYGLSRKALVRWLRETRPEQWKQVQVIRSLCRVEDAEQGLDVACDALSLARAREQLRAGQWTLERLDSSNYGQKQEMNVTVDHKVSIEHSLADSALDLFKSIRSGTKTVEQGPMRVIEVMSNDEKPTEGGV